ncbi:DNA-3-methyladenine glycosylase 2 family protein [Leekyejoonella antrihumi]|uniref:DNA-3-methyladenine glycosylase II n=1 Tax=Leekyejoonella antrihumi TaxID=1660198 RepID=A0A563DX06_9MICO|nr:AlkA N-terminal domain-containing protein [Leekyejoonella antrihumi]TWP34735.1 DNA-3-methyladenine glycosylase 2 family protein [Leekyejoonella antrihumi]
MNDDVRLRAIRAKDARFDGWFIVAVRTTRIYCRPSCPARTPHPKNVTFLPSAAAAQAAGYRACKRCRPDASPGSPEWSTRADLVARAMRLIADGVVDREGVNGLAARLGYSTRQIERQVRAQLGAGPLALARAQRAQTARTLVETTGLPLTEVAYAAGFGSVRAFNKMVREVFGLTPGELRRRAPGHRSTRDTVQHDGWQQLRLRLPFRRPLCPDNLFGHLAATAVPGVEEWRAGAYRRTLRLPHGPGVVAVKARADHIQARLWLTDLRDLTTAVNRCRHLLDLDADPQAIDEQLGADPVLAAMVRAAPGRRVPRTTDGEEFAVRLVLGQQISTRAARTHAGRLADAYGTPIDDPDGGLSRLFPPPEVLVDATDESLAMPQSRRRTVRALCTALAQQEIDLSPGADWATTRDRLLRLPGVGPWTVEGVAMRVQGDPDAFLATDLGVRRALDALHLPGSAAGRAEITGRWSPWRAYAVQHLWAMGDHEINRIPTGDTPS